MPRQGEGWVFLDWKKPADGGAVAAYKIERLWRSVKYEEVYLKEYVSVWDCRDALRRYFEFYNHERRHQGLGRQTPWDVYQTGV